LRAIPHFRPRAVTRKKHKFEKALPFRPYFPHVLPEKVLAQVVHTKRWSPAIPSRERGRLEKALIMSISVSAEASSRSSTLISLSFAKAAVLMEPAIAKMATAKYGRGFAVCRRAGGSGWSAPAAMQVEAGSFGFQIGASETDVALLVMNDGGMKHLLSDKFSLGGDASVAAGPIGRDASARTDAELQTEMLSYSRSHGIFAGISLTGATLRPDGDTNRDLYGHDTTNREILTGEFKTPAAARKFEHALNRDSATRN
jgi:lipid-binding SYLF domain-containing protein